MKLDPDALTLSFGSAKEMNTFYLQLTGVVREAVAEASKGTYSADEASAASRALFKRYPTVLRTLNALRKGLREEPG